MLSILTEFGEHWYVHPNGRIYARDPNGPDWEITPQMQREYYRKNSRLKHAAKLLVGGTTGSLLGTSLGIGGAYLMGFHEPSGVVPVGLGSFGGSLVGGLLSVKHLGNKMLNHIAKNPQEYKHA